MSQTQQTSDNSRRNFLKVAGAAALVGSPVHGAYAGGNSIIQLALVGAGGRGTGAAANALATKAGPTRLVAMADVFEDRLANSHKALTARYRGTVDVPEDRKFIGFEAYREAMDVLRPGDVVILTTPAAFRWVMFSYAIEKGLNVFMEKPISVDGPSSKKMIELGKHHVLAAALFYGREELIPEMFQPMLEKLHEAGVPCGKFIYYLKRHIELDAGEHSVWAENLVSRLCDGHSERVAEARAAAGQVLHARLQLWDGILDSIRRKDVESFRVAGA